MNQIDLEALRVEEPFNNTLSSELKNKQKGKKRCNFDTWFIASMSGPWIAEAAKLPGHALHVALAIMYVHGIKSKLEIVLTRYHFDRFHTDTGPTRRGLAALQEAGLIQYAREGHKHKITVLPVVSDGEAASTDTTIDKG